MKRPATAAVLTMVVTSGCAPQAPAAHSVTELAPFASGTAPLTNLLDIAIVTGTVACTANSFDSRIRCVDRNSGDVSMFGREGEGPGEFDGLTSIERAPGERVAAMDFGLGRMTVFETDGTIVSETALPPIFRPLQLVDGHLFGYKLGALDFSSAEELPEFVPMAADVGSGEVVWQRTDLAGVLDRDCFTGVAGGLTPDGGVVFEVCGHEVAFLADPRAQSATVVVSPSYVEAFPSDRDASDHREGLTDTGRRGGMTEHDIDTRLAAFRRTPKEWILKRPFRFDDRGRLWVATTLDHDAFSHFDIWDGTVYAGSVRVHDRLLAFDILGLTLVTLVERAGTGGVSQLGVDWYDIRPS